MKAARPIPIVKTQMFMESLVAAKTPEAKIKESPVMNGINAPINSPVPANTNPQTIR
jgi:hypothetical protein